MTPESVMMMGTEAMKVALALAAPLLLVALVTGLIISILQAATQINEMTLSFIPKIIAVFIAIIIAGPWMLNLLLDYVRTLSERTQRAETGKTRSGNDDHFRYCPIITCQRCSCFFVLCSVAGRAADPDRHCAWFYHAICLCRCANRW